MLSLSSSFCLFLCLLSSPFLSNANTNSKLGFTTDLIHRDSPKSPFYKPSETSSQRLRNAINRSINRVFHFSGQDTSTSSPQSEVALYGGEYFMKISLGTPPFPVMAIADTGSDLLWTQCKPCNRCYTQDDPLFDPRASSTYKNVSCSSSQCHSIKDDTSCSREDNTCTYAISYMDNSYTKGNIAVDTLTLGSTNNRPVQFQNIIIGCGQNDIGIFQKEGSGIVGLGAGSVSLISQLSESIHGKFSYCLVLPSSTNNPTSKINFGTSAVVSGTGAVSTPLITKAGEPFYYLTLESISVGSKNLKFPSSVSRSGKGNIFIDSGTSFTMLPTAFYSELEAAVASSINAERKKDPESGLSLCYNANLKANIPIITFHFDGADVKLENYNSFIRVSQDLVCFAFLGKEGVVIYGNRLQMNFVVGYDTISKKVSIKPADCATFV